MDGKWEFFFSKATESMLIVPNKSFKTKAHLVYSINITKKGNVSLRKDGKSLFCTRDKPINRAEENTIRWDGCKMLLINGKTYTIGGT